MKVRHCRNAAAAAAACLALLHTHDALAQATVRALSEPVGLASPVRPVKGGEAVYIIQLKDPGAASYKGGRAGLAATKPQAGERFDRRSAAVESYVRYVEQTHDRLLGAVGASGAKLYSFRYTLNGFAARLTPEQVSRLAQEPEVERITRDSEQRVRTNNSAVFLGLENQVGGLRADLDLRGEDVVVGIIDSGIAPDHPSLLDYETNIPRACESQWARASWLGRWLCHSYRHNPEKTQVYDPPVGFTGACEAGDGFEPDDCNNKLVGARYYVDGFLVQNELDPNEFLSPKDADGHGTHIATTVAGNAVSAYLFGTRVARVAGIAPRARVAVYKACWLKPGDTRASCATSDLARAIDDAVADGVDIINYSLGSLETDLTAPDDLALLNAVDAGVLTVVAAGNDGPELDTIGSPSSAPWVLTVAASTLNGELFDTAISILEPEDIAGEILMREASFTPALTREDALDGTLVAADDEQQALTDGVTGSIRDACQPLQNTFEVDGNVVLIERGGCEFQVKLQNAEDAGAIAAIVYNTTGAPIVMNGEAGSVGIPAVMIGDADGLTLLDRLEAGNDEVTVELVRGSFVGLREEGNVVGDFSSRGPPLSDRNFLKPDVTAPGINILAGHTPDVANGLRGESFQYLSGTSQSAPEAAGLAALLKEAHPDWSPGALKSALMTSAYQDVVRSDGEPADPFDMGAGHVDANKANDPGLVYDSDFRDHAAYLCGLPKPPFPAEDCAALAAGGLSSDPTQLNLPSIALAELITGDAVTRRVTNVGPPASFTAEVLSPADIDIIVAPPSLVLGTGQTAEFTVRFVDRGAPLDLWSFGELAWTDGTRRVASPVALQPVALRVPTEVRLRGSRGSAVLPAAFGYAGEYLAVVHGLRAPYADDVTGEVPRGFVDDDVSNSFTFRFDNGVTAHAIDVPADQLHLRVALFDEFTDGADDLDLYLFYCPNDQCTQVAQSGGFTSDEEINLTTPQPGKYVALVHGFQTDQIAGGPGANYSLFTWSFGIDDDVGNMAVAAPTAVTDGDRLDLAVEWAGLDPATRYIGGISHNTPLGTYALTIVNIDAP